MGQHKSCLVEVTGSHIPKYLTHIYKNFSKEILLWRGVLWWFLDFLSPQIHAKLPENVAFLHSLTFYSKGLH